RLDVDADAGRSEGSGVPRRVPRDRVHLPQDHGGEPGDGQVGDRRLAGAPVGMQFGAHVSSSGGIDTAIDRIEAIGGECVQVFTQSPRMWRPTNHKPEAIERFKARRAEAGIGGVMCHALYLCNLAAPNDEVYEKSVATM